MPIFRSSGSACLKTRRNGVDMSDNYKIVLAQLLRLAALMIEGKGTGAEANEIRNASDEPWYDLSEAEQDRISTLSRQINEAQGGPQ